MFNKKLFEYGGIAASIVLIVFGIGAIALGLNGRSTVRDSLKLEQIVGSPDMTRDAIATEAKKAGLTNVVLPGGDVAGQLIDTGQGTNDAAAAQKYPNGQPMSNSARDIWVTETALTTALNTSYMAEQLAIFGIVVGIALLLSGIGFGVLTLGGALKRRSEPRGTHRPMPVAAV